MVRQEIPLLVHGEVTDPHVDIFDREKVFIDRILAPLVQKLPQLKIVMEHITTMDAVNFIESCELGQAIVSAVTKGSRRYFLGTDSAPHDKRNKECSCGCAGIYSAPVALSLYAKVFEEAGALDNLEAFTSFNGPDFYGLPRNTSKIVLRKSGWEVSATYKHSSGEIVPMFAGSTLEWLPSDDEPKE
ncbi:dihydroorotase, mitochondrial-like isoform X1 [Miscanthus floridulus]|uniref:dihydroorotase, mitochondrial-like isoform X1 n=1 Tax=Miscanthus floridulus TaxID=154761 RepID=UPI00345AB504